MTRINVVKKGISTLKIFIGKMYIKTNRRKIIIINLRMA